MNLKILVYNQSLLDALKLEAGIITNGTGTRSCDDGFVWMGTSRSVMTRRSWYYHLTFYGIATRHYQSGNI
jgi:hypothetical protein